MRVEPWLRRVVTHCKEYDRGFQDGYHAGVRQAIAELKLRIKDLPEALQ